LEEVRGGDKIKGGQGRQATNLDARREARALGLFRDLRPEVRPYGGPAIVVRPPKPTSHDLNVSAIHTAPNCGEWMKHGISSRTSDMNL